MTGIRAQQKEKTRQTIMRAALKQLSAETSFSGLSLREVAREAGIAPTSFYRHFKDMEELGLTLVDECGVTLRQLMRKARKRIDTEDGVIQISVDTFMEFVENNAQIFRLLLRERSGTSKAFRNAVAREIRHFTDELTAYIIETDNVDEQHAFLQAEAMVTIVFNAGAEALDCTKNEREQLKERVVQQLWFIVRGAVVRD
ncbi:HTH-type transcriptional repressor FabR [Pleionea sp. CnH1-48]|uniref:HTH-type transcriptional repressor FabR n=1 Tax=Pleionea sp. CnH1-48 TaxID=2954494 RepID=UPI0020984206|nr:HTH-type transcriptional repressor FabR [Pleionea sp. CnH1-48]MCO7222776.1 HTH-type transcriptional repressor FabR [Pleionea sp. CnH1-48]